MEAWAKMNEMISLLQKVQDANPQFGHGPVTSRDVLNYINDDPAAFQEMLNFSKSLDMSGELGQNIGPNFVADLADDWKLLPSEIQLLNLDYTNIKEEMVHSGDTS